MAPTDAQAAGARRRGKFPGGPEIPRAAGPPGGDSGANQRPALARPMLRVDGAYMKKAIAIGLITYLNSLTGSRIAVSLGFGITSTTRARIEWRIHSRSPLTRTGKQEQRFVYEMLDLYRDDRLAGDPLAC